MRTLQGETQIFMVFDMLRRTLNTRKAREKGSERRIGALVECILQLTSKETDFKGIAKSFLVGEL
jgi:hypothetical protein